MTCVCSVGLDMICVPGDTSASTISAIIADEAAIGMINQKTTAVRIIPAPGKKVGDVVEIMAMSECPNNCEHCFINYKVHIDFYELEQILNAYQQSTTKTRENELVDELYLLTDEIQNGKTTTIVELINMTIKKVTSLSDKVNVNDTLQTFNSLNCVIDYIADRNNPVNARKDKFKRELIRNYFEVMLQSKANEEETSIETLATIDSFNRRAMVNYLIEFSKRVQHFDDEQKSKVASTINFVCTSNEPSEVKIYKSIDLIAKHDLTIDLLGKKIQAKTKVKVEE